MSLKKEVKKVGEKIENLAQDKDERALDCFNIIKANNIKLFDAKTGIELTEPIAGIGRIAIEEGNRLEYCLDEYKEKGYITETEYSSAHPLHITSISNLFGETS